MRRDSRGDAAFAALGRRPRWPLPALLAWAACWVAFAALRSRGAAGRGRRCRPARRGARRCSASTPWRRVFVAAGFPLSFARLGRAGALPAWAWLAAARRCSRSSIRSRAWRDAPLFPTPARRAARPRRAGAPLAPRCGRPRRRLRPRRRRWSSCAASIPQATLAGIEWSWPLRARVRLALPLRARPARRLVERRLVARSRSSTSSSARRAWRAPPPRRRASCAPAPGWRASSSRSRRSSRSASSTAPTAAASGSTGAPFRRERG